jgi:hypothetical protein
MISVKAFDIINTDKAVFRIARIDKELWEYRFVNLKLNSLNILMNYIISVINSSWKVRA